MGERSVRAVREAWHEVKRPDRLLLAAKTALAVGIAWAIAPHMPGVTDQYPYYAPLGALVSMYPTLMASARAGVQTLLGLAAGIGLAILVIMTIGPNWWSIPVIVGIGILLSGTGWFGAGREYVPMAALFVLIIGGPQADAYSVGYLVQMAVGVVVGLIVNVTVAPALTSAAAGAKVDAFQRQIAGHLHDVGEAVQETWPPEHAAWSRNDDALRRTADEVRQALADGDESRRGNPRAMLHRRDTRRDHLRLATLETITFHVRDISGALADTIWDRPGALHFDPAIAAPLSAACHAVATAIDQDDHDSPQAHRARGQAARSVRALVQMVDARTLEVGSTMGPGVLSAIHLRRILVHLRQATTDSDADSG